MNGAGEQERSGKRPVGGGVKRSDRGFTLSWAVAVLIAVAAALVAIWWPPYTPGQDTPHHLFFAQVVATPERFAADYRVVFAPTSQGFVYLAALFQPLGLVVAGKLVRTVGLALLLVAYWVLGRAAGEGRSPGLLFGAAVSCSFFHGMGFENFALALPLGLLAVGLTGSAARVGGAIRWVLVGLVMALVAVGHAVLAGMVGVELLLVVLLVAPGSLRWRRLGGLLAAGAPAALYSALCVWISASAQVDRGITEGLGRQRLPLGEQLANVVQCSFGGYSGFGGLVVCAALALALAQWVGRKSALSSRHRLARRVALATVVLWGLIYLVTPFHGAGWAYAQPRVLALAIFAPLGLIGWGRWRFGMLALTAVSVLLFLATSAISQREAGEAIAAQVSRFGDGPVGNAMAVTLDPGSPPTSRHIGALSGSELYAVAQGGAVPHVQAANPAIHTVLALRQPSEWPPHPPLFIFRSIDCRFNPDCAEAALVLAERIAVQGLRYDTVFLVGGPQLFRDALVSRGYGRTASDRFVPRPAELRLAFEGTEGLEDQLLLVRAGYPGGLGWFAAAQRPPGPVTGPLTLTLAPLPAGPITVECRWLQPDQGVAMADDAPIGCRLETLAVAGERRELRVGLAGLQGEAIRNDGSSPGLEPAP
ncbi:MAG: hypothetical protein JW797_11110 [Bradymonadales bacterium]|nr:hypothetical protein [Bradymonadales bacterium]